MIGLDQVRIIAHEDICHLVPVFDDPSPCIGLDERLVGPEEEEVVIGYRRCSRPVAWRRLDLLVCRVHATGPMKVVDIEPLAAAA